MKIKFYLLALLAVITIFYTGCTEGKEINDLGNLVAKTVDQDATIPAIRVNNALFHSEAFGPVNGPLIIVLHGGPGADYRYLLRCQEFATQGYRVVFYDQRGTGLSQRFPKSIYTLQIAYDDLSAVISHYKTSPTQKVFLLGHSWGAMLATAYIEKYPTAISGAVLAEPGGFIWKDVEDYLDRSRKISLSSEKLNDATYIDQFITGEKNQHAILDYKLNILSAQESSEIGNEGKLPGWRFGAVTLDAYFSIGDKQKPNWTVNLNNYTTKVLFIYSANNKAYGLAHAQKVSSAYPNIQLFKTEAAGHDMLSFTTGWNNTYPTMLSYFNSLK